MKINIVNRSKHKLTEDLTEKSAGMDIRANLENEIILKPFERALINTGLFLEITSGYEAQIRPRSGLTIKSGISILNSPGTIDADYRGEVCIILINLSNENFLIHNGDRICQMVIAKHERASWNEVEVLNVSDRGTGGSGHTEKY